MNWIRVEHVKPENGAAVLIYTKETNGVSIAWIRGDCWVGENFDGSQEEDLPIPTHWMPLPEDPR